MAPTVRELGVTMLGAKQRRQWQHYGEQRNDIVDEPNEPQHNNVHGTRHLSRKKNKNTGGWNLPYMTKSNSIGHNSCEDL